MPPPADDVERAPSYDEVDDSLPPSSTVVTQKEEVTEQIFDQGESISESSSSVNLMTRRKHKNTRNDSALLVAFLLLLLVAFLLLQYVHPVWFVTVTL